MANLRRIISEASVSGEALMFYSRESKVYGLELEPFKLCQPSGIF